MKKKNIFTIDDSQFYKLVDDLFYKIEDNLNIYNNTIDIDYEIQNDVFSITFLNKSMIIVNKQTSLKQIWLATSTNGYHFNYKNKIWMCNRTNKNFWKIFHQACSMQSNKNLDHVIYASIKK